jgi:hypothetical protein
MKLLLIALGVLLVLGVLGALFGHRANATARAEYREHRRDGR